MFEEFGYPSYNGRDTIKAWIYVPIRKPIGIVQVVHGLGEHSRRYLHLILKLNEAGFVVSADDHVGHGKTAADSDTWGDYGDKGYMTTTEDEKSLHDIVTKKFPGLPFCMYGHSWGSMIARNYAAVYGSTLSALTICGTCGQIEGMEEPLKMVKALIDAGKGGERDPQVAAASLSFIDVSRYGPNAGPMDWISGDKDVVADHGRDPFNNLKGTSTTQSVYDLMALINAITGPNWAAKVPRELPIYNIAGGEDPVGNFGEGVCLVTNWLVKTGHREVTTKLYQGHRHEIHNDRDIREEVTDGILNFFEKNVKK
jgi:alpha-beta hydrolase superfamily lysophospholipase